MSDNSSTNSSSDVSSSESEEESFNDIKELCENFAKLKPYDFEPLASTDESEGDEEDEKSEDSDATDKEEEEPVIRRDNTSWCQCDGCEAMSTETESVCCQELNEIREEKFGGN